MKSAIRPIGEALAHHDFDLVFVDYVSEHNCIYVRRCLAYLGLYERVEVSWLGKRCEAVAAEVQLSHVLSRAGVECALQRQLITDFELIDRWGHVSVTSKWQRSLWITELARAVPTRMNELALAVGRRMLAESASARAAVERYLSHWTPAESMYAAITSLRRGARDEEIRRAVRIAEWPWVQSFDSDTEVYEAATLLLTRFAKEVGDDEWSLLQEDPLQNLELMLRIQLIADRIDPAPRPVCLTKDGPQQELP